jgi:CDP-glycerol glycerophosphotransferase (TagB/SpsB family)
LFEYVNEKQPETTAVWLSKNEKVRARIRGKGYRCYHPYGVRGLYYSLISEVNVIATSFQSDTHWLWPQKTTINLWHGIPLKKIMYDDTLTSTLTKKRSWLFRATDSAFPYKAPTTDKQVVVVSSADEQANLASAMRLPKEKVLVLGSPRLDALYKPEPRTDGDGRKRILYMPTHRGQGQLNIVDLLIADMARIDAKLAEVGCLLYIKLHYYHEAELESCGEFENILLLRDNDIDQDIYTFLPNVDILITDYSSVYFDFLLTARPIIFAPFDIEQYLTNDRKLYYDYNDVTPGPKCRGWDEVMSWIERLACTPELYREERELMRNRFHRYQDGQNSRRVFAETARIVRTPVIGTATS